jgi:hypothetical protein
MQYMCQFNINGLDSANDFFLQLTSLNNSTHYSVKLSNGAAPVDFDGVSPQVDSTGAVESTFRRVQVRLSTGDTPILPNAIDTGSGICKDFTVSNAPSTFSDQCY